MSSAFAAAVESGSLDEIATVLHPDIRFSSPAVFTPYEGRAATLAVLRAFTATVSDFHYVGAYRADDGAETLRFRARVGDFELEGVDLEHYDDAGLVDELTVLIRPLKGVTELVARMGVLLAG